MSKARLDDQGRSLAAGESKQAEILIIGDIVIKHMVPTSLLSKNTEIKVTMKTAYIWEEAKEYLVNGYNETLPDSIILH